MLPETDLEAIHESWAAAADSLDLTEGQRVCLIGARCLRVIDPRQGMSFRPSAGAPSATSSCELKADTSRPA